MLLAVFRAPLWLFLLITVVVALAAVFEYLGIAAGYGFEPFRLLTYIYTAALFVVYYYAQGFGGGALLAGILMLFLFAPFLLMIAAMGREDLKAALPGAAMSYLALPYIGLPLLLLALLRDSGAGMGLCAVYVSCRVGGRHRRDVRRQEHGTAQVGAADQSRQNR